MQRAFFITEPLARTKPDETNALLLMQEAERRGVEVWQATPENLTIDDNGNLVAYARRVSLQLSTLPHYVVLREEWVALATMDVVFMRHQPPFDLNYLSVTYLLEHLPPQVPVVNNPVTVRHHPEKLLPFRFQQFMPPTVVSSEREALEAFWHKHHDIVIKPLYQYDGHGVIRVCDDCGDFGTVLRMEMQAYNQPLMAQAYLPEVQTEGSRRLIVLNGEIVGALATLPSAGSVDTHLGGRDVVADIKPADHALMAELGPWLTQHGVFFAGVDMIGDWLTEINITCPGMLIEYNALHKTRIEQLFWDKLEAWVGAVRKAA